MHYVTKSSGSLYEFAGIYKTLGLHYSPEDKGWYYREWAPNAYALYLCGDFNWWDRHSHPLKRNTQNYWEIFLDDATYGNTFVHGSLFKVVVHSRNAVQERLPAYAFRVFQNPDTKDYSAQVWDNKTYKWEHESPIKKGISEVYIYESHTGMAQEKEAVGTYREFADIILPRVVKAGYTVVQLMAVQEHPYYGSYGYHVSNFFAPSSRFGTPEDLKYLVDTAHGLGLAIIMDLVHSHSVKNINEGLNLFDGSEDQYFCAGERGNHPAWDSKVFNYGKWEVQQFLLSNVRYWLEEYHFDGYRFDGITSMLYQNHGLNMDFTGLPDYFTPNTNPDAVLYLQLANHLIHTMQPNAISVAEDVSGFPGLGRPEEEGGVGFDFRLGMGLPDYWIKLIQTQADEEWNMHELYGTLINRRQNEKTIAYAESHDQALVGDQTIAFRLMKEHMYSDMANNIQSLNIDRGMALHKLIRLITLSLGGEGWLNFMGNEFGHPDWIDFPREGNNWSFSHARRQWSLAENGFLRYRLLGNFDEALIKTSKDNALMQSRDIQLCHIDDHNKVIAYTRGGLLFACNFHPTESWFEYGIQLPAPGSYKVILNSDDELFGGHNRITPGIEYFTDPNGLLKIYLPNRTGLVFKQVGV